MSIVVVDLTVGTSYTVDYSIMQTCGSVVTTVASGAVGPFIANSTTVTVPASGSWNQTLSPGCVLSGAAKLTIPTSPAASIGFMESNGNTTTMLPTPSNCTTPPPPLTLTCAANIGQVGVPYSSSLVATGGVTPYTFSVTSGSLPTGLMLNASTGAITGTPTATGTFDFTSTVMDSSGNSANNTTSDTCTVTISPTAPALTISKTADNATVTAGSTIGFTVTISNTGNGAATGLMLTDPLPTGGNEFFQWTIDSTTGNPADFTINGSPGSQSLAFSSNFLASDSLAAGQSISVHITTPTTSGDVSGGAVGLQSGVSSAAYLGAAGNYGVLYMVGSGTHNLQITNVTLGANIGVGSAVGGNGVGNVNFNGPGIITGRLDFAPGQTNRFNNNNGSNVGPASVNTNVAAVASAISTVTSLSSSLGGLTGTNITIHGTQTINESSGTLQIVNGVTYSVFTVVSYSENDGSLVTINGDGSGNPVVLNFGANTGNINLGGDVALGGNGLNDDKVIWNFSSSNQNLQLNNNASSFPSVAFHGIILAPNDGIHLVNANLSGRIFGGDNQDMQLVSGLTLHAPILNTATVSGLSASATITVTGPFLPSAHFQ
ncbi:MAG TPA: putative Ig domain-containing protein [Candidatus Acidoferrum sp.]